MQKDSGTDEGGRWKRSHCLGHPTEEPWSLESTRLALSQGNVESESCKLSMLFADIGEGRKWGICK